MNNYPSFENDCIRLGKDTSMCIFSAEEYLQNKDSDVLLQKLPADEQNKYLKYRKKQDREMFLCSRLLLRTEFEKKLNLDFDFQLSYNEFQKPYLKDYPNFHFNISHSAGCVAIAYSDNSVGVDIEKIVNYDKKELLRYADTVFNRQEIDVLQSLNENSSQYFFTKLWTMKESVIKNLGSGFSYNTKYIIFDSIIYSDKKLSHNKFENLKVISFDYKTDYIISITSPIVK